MHNSGPSSLICINYVITIIFTLQILRFVNADCPKETSSLRRLNSTRFYIVGTSLKSDLSTWEKARGKCEEKGLKLAQIDSFAEDATIGRALELSNIIGSATILHKYWIEGKYDPNGGDDEGGAYVSKDGKMLNYHNILFRGTQAIGYGQDITDDGTEIKPVNTGPPKCLAYGITYTRPNDKSELGYETRMDETPCDDKHFALCEAERDSCPSVDDSNHLEMTDAKDSYLEDGNWIFGNPRRFIVNWKPRRKNESSAYCSEKGMVLYRPSSKDGCIIPYLALWNRRITTANFWADIHYNIVKKKFTFWNGEEIPIGSPFANATTSSRALGKGEKLNVCVQSAYSYEHKELGCPDCEWNAIVLVPANCLLRVATICQHVDDKGDAEGSCGQIWGTRNEVYTLLNNYERRQHVVNNTHTIPFHSRSIYTQFYRSTYKQIWGPRLCPRGYSLATTETVIPPPDEKGDYYYDAEEDYWVAEKYRGFALKGKQCVLSKWLGDKRTLVKDVDCNEWHFYLCEKNPDNHLLSGKNGKKTKKG